jgi:hypothetical protein
LPERRSQTQIFQNKKQVNKLKYFTLRFTLFVSSLWKEYCWRITPYRNGIVDSFSCSWSNVVLFIHVNFGIPGNMNAVCSHGQFSLLKSSVYFRETVQSNPYWRPISLRDVCSRLMPIYSYENKFLWGLWELSHRGEIAVFALAEIAFI